MRTSVGFPTQSEIVARYEEIYYSRGWGIEYKELIISLGTYQEHAHKGGAPESTRANEAAKALGVAIAAVGVSVRISSRFQGQSHVVFAVRKHC